MRRSTWLELFPFDPEIDRTYHRRKRDQRMAGEREERSLRSYIMPTVQGIIQSIVPPPITTNNFEIRPAVISMIQNSLQFSGLPSEDPNQHLAKFLNICNTFKVNGASEEAITLRVFPFSLTGRAWNWLDSLPPNSITTWAQLVEKFLGKYFPPSKTGQLRNEITNFRQQEGESLYEAWERMKDLQRRCPHHGLPKEVLLQTFYQGTLQNTKYLLDAAAGGSLMNLSYQGAYEKIEDMANNVSHHYGGERTATPKKPVGVLEVGESTAYMAKIDASLRELTNQVKSMQLGAASQACQMGAMPMYGDAVGEDFDQVSEGSVGQ